MKLRILFLGNAYNPYSIACLESLVEAGHDVIVGCHDAASAGKRRLVARTIRTRGPRLVVRKAVRLGWARARLALRAAGVPLPGFASLPELLAVHPARTIPCANANRPEFLARVHEEAVDLIVVAAFSQILKPPLIALPRLGCINVHPSLLPRYRGPHPIYWALHNRDWVTGVTIHYVDAGIDTGDIILQRPVEIRRGETEASLQTRVIQAATQLLPETLRLIAAGTAPRIPQDESQATYYSFPPKGVLTLL